MCFRPAAVNLDAAKCPKCGTDFTPGQEKCSKCGAVLPKLPGVSNAPKVPGAPGAPSAPKVPGAPGAPKAPGK